MDAVSGKQLYATNQKITTLQSTVAQKADTSLSNLTDAGKTKVKDIMKEDLDQKADATALNSEATARQSADTALTNQIQTLSDQAVTYNADKSKVRLAGTNGTKLTNLQEADLSATSMDAVSGKQLYATNQNITTLQSTVAQKADTSLSNLTDDGKAAVKKIMETDLSQKADATALNSEVTARQSADTALTNQIQTLSDEAVTYNADKSEVKLAGTNGTKLTNLQEGNLSATSTDAVSGKQLYATNQNITTLRSTVAQKADTSLSNLTDDGKAAVKKIMETDLSQKADATALNSEVTARQSADTALTNQIQTLSDEAVTYNADKSEVKLAGTNGTKLTNLQEGNLSATSTDAVSGKQLYATNQNITTLQGTVAQKADKTDVYTKTEVDSQVSNLNTSLSGKADTSLSNLTDTGRAAVKDIMKSDLDKKANQADIYTKTEVDSQVSNLNTSLSGKADTSLSNLTDTGRAVVKDIMKSDLDKKANQADVYTKTEVDSQVSNLNTSLSGKADTSLSNLTDTGRAVVKDIMKSDLDKKANQADVYTKTEVDSQVSNLNTSLSGKADTSLSNLTDTGRAAVKDIMKSDLDKKANQADVYTKTEIDSQVSSLNTSLSGKADTSLSNLTEAGKTAVKDIMKADLDKKANQADIYTKTEVDSQVSSLNTNLAGKADASLSNLTDAGKTAVKDIMKDDLAQKADKSTVYTKDETYNRTEIDGKVSNLTTDIAGKADTSLSNLTDAGKSTVKGIMKDDLAQKADKSTVYTKDETYNRGEIDGKVSGLTTDLAGKADASLSNLTDAGKTAVKAIMKDDLSKKADVSTVYTKTEVDSQVNGLKTDLSGKADASLSNLTYAGKTAVKNIMKDDMAQKVDKSAANLSADDVKNWQDKLGNGNIARGDHGLISGGKVFEALQGVGNYGLVKSDGKVVNIAKDDSAKVIDVSGAGTNRVITGVKTDVRDPSSAANVAYVNGNTQQIYQDMNQAYGSLRNDISRAAASSNALAALKPMEFDSDDKLQFGIGYGHYHNANAAAVGAFYQPDENCMMNLGASLGNGDPGISAGITIKFGPGGSGVPTLSKKQMAQIIQKQSAQLDEQSKEIESLKRANEEMKEQFKAIMEKLNDQH